MPAEAHMANHDPSLSSTRPNTSVSRRGIQNFRPMWAYHYMAARLGHSHRPANRQPPVPAHLRSRRRDPGLRPVWWSGDLP